MDLHSATTKTELHDDDQLDNEVEVETEVKTEAAIAAEVEKLSMAILIALWIDSGFPFLFCASHCFCDCLLRCDNRFIKKAKYALPKIYSNNNKSLYIRMDMKGKRKSSRRCGSVTRLGQRGRQIFNAHSCALRCEIVIIVQSIVLHATAHMRQQREHQSAVCALTALKVIWIECHILYRRKTKIFWLHSHRGFAVYSARRQLLFALLATPTCGHRKPEEVERAKMHLVGVNAALHEFYYQIFVLFLFFSFCRLQAFHTCKPWIYVVSLPIRYICIYAYLWDGFCIFRCARQILLVAMRYIYIYRAIHSFIRIITNKILCQKCWNFS